MKKCPQCNTENPSSANNCMNCGASLGEGKLPEELLLRKQLTEANETIAHLNESLAQAKKKIVDASVLAKKIDSLKNEVDNKNSEIGRQKTEIDSLKGKVDDLEKSNKDLKKLSTSPKWSWIFVVLFAVTTIVIVFTIGKIVEKEDELAEAHSTIQSLKDDLRNDLSLASNSLQDSLIIYRNIAAEKQKQLRKLQDKWWFLEFFVKKIEIANVYREGKIETDYGGKIYASQSMFIKPRITVVSNFFPDYSSASDISVKIFNPDGTLSRGSSSPEGYTYVVDKVPISDDHGEEIIAELKCWGGEKKGFWPAGKYRIEIWYDSICIKDDDFNIY